MTPHMPNPSGIRRSANSHRQPADSSNPFEILGSRKQNRDEVAAEFESRREAVFDPGKRGALGWPSHCLCELLRGEIIDPETEAGEGEEEEERESLEDWGVEGGEKVGETGWRDQCVCWCGRERP